MAIGISWIGAAGAGALSFLSPCVLPLVLPYLCYMAGVGVDDFHFGAGTNSRQQARRALILAVVSFVLGFTVIFVALGASATAIGGFLLRCQQEVAALAGIVIILMGLNFLGVLRLSLLSHEARFQARSAPAGPVGAFIMGLTFAFGWTPCIGPILSLILTLASSKETIDEGAILLAIYSLGLGIPFILAAIFSSTFMRFLQRFHVHLSKIEKVIGLLLVAAGLLFLNGKMQNFSYWLLETFPALGRFG